MLKLRKHSVVRACNRYAIYQEFCSLAWDEDLKASQKVVLS
jgi:hypothetical protein